MNPAPTAMSIATVANGERFIGFILRPSFPAPKSSAKIVPHNAI